MAIFNSYVKLPEGIYTPRNYFGKQIAGGKILLNLRRKLVNRGNPAKTPKNSKAAGSTVYVKTTKYRFKDTHGTMGDYAGRKHDHTKKNNCKPELPARV
jgi:hypothetical protein